MQNCSFNIYERTVDILSWLKQNLPDHHGVLKNTIVLEQNKPPGKWISKHYGATLSGIVGKHAHLPTCRVYMTIHSAGFDT